MHTHTHTLHMHFISSDTSPAHGGRTGRNGGFANVSHFETSYNKKTKFRILRTCASRLSARFSRLLIAKEMAVPCTSKELKSIVGDAPHTSDGNISTKKPAIDW
jgi:hypothetical protein